MKLQINQHPFGLFKVLVLLLCAMLCNNGHAQHGKSPVFTETVLAYTGGSGAATIGGNKKLDASGFSVYGTILYQVQDLGKPSDIGLADTGGAGTTVMTSGAGNKKLDVLPANVHAPIDDTGGSGSTAVGSSTGTAGNKKLDFRLS